MDVKWICFVGLVPMLPACASNPKVDMQYYLAETVLDLEVSRSLTCTDRDELVIASSSTIKANHRADYDSDPAGLNLGELSGFLVDSDVSFEFYADGRLKGLNSTATGQGEKVFSSGIELATAVFGAHAGPPKTQFPEICDAINGPPKDGKNVRSESVTITYSGSVEVAVSDVSRPININIKPESMPIALRLGKAVDPRAHADEFVDLLESQIGSVVATVEEIEVSQSLYDVGDQGIDGMLSLPMRRTGRALVTIAIEYADTPGIYSAYVDRRRGVDVAAKGEEYWLALPKPKLFGNQTFELAVTEAGGVSKIGYGTESGASGILTVGESLDKQTSGQSYADKAAEEKARADFIAQQQRRIRCEADPSNCE